MSESRLERATSALLPHTLLTDRYPFRCTCGEELTGYLGFTEHQAAAVLAALDGDNDTLDGDNDTQAAVEQLRSALERTEANFIAAVNGRPVRDMTETLAENRAALAALAGPQTGGRAS